MAIVWHVFRDKTEATTPPAVNGVSPIEGGVLVRHDDVADTVRYCFYILLRSGFSAGRYEERWRVQNAALNQSLSSPVSVSAQVAGTNTDLLLLPPVGTTTATPQDISLGDHADPTDAQIIAGVSGFGSSVAGRFAAATPRTTFNTNIASPRLQAEF